MYIPAHFAAPADLLDSLLDSAALAELVTHRPETGFAATPLPLLRAGDALHGHVARNNPQWRHGLEGDCPALVIVRGPDAYVSPTWYPSKAEHGRVVPTWNYQVVHVHGRLVTHDDPGWTEQLVRRLTVRHEAGMPKPWSVDDMPADFLAGQLRAIVGIEIRIERIEAKSKLSQNRPPADAAAVLSALGGGDARQQAVAEAMREL